MDHGRLRASQAPDLAVTFAVPKAHFLTPLFALAIPIFFSAAFA
jgi:hypothetical protein